MTMRLVRVAIWVINLVAWFVWSMAEATVLYFILNWITGLFGGPHINFVVALFLKFACGFYILRGW